jgi:hypothetical protein
MLGNNAAIVDPSQANLLCCGTVMPAEAIPARQQHIALEFVLCCHILLLFCYFLQPANVDPSQANPLCCGTVMQAEAIHTMSHARMFAVMLSFLCYFSVISAARQCRPVPGQPAVLRHSNAGRGHSQRGEQGGVSIPDGPQHAAQGATTINAGHFSAVVGVVRIGKDKRSQRHRCRL